MTNKYNRYFIDFAISTITNDKMLAKSYLEKIKNESIIDFNGKIFFDFCLLSNSYELSMEFYYDQIFKAYNEFKKYNQVTQRTIINVEKFDENTPMLSFLKFQEVQFNISG